MWVQLPTLASLIVVQLVFLTRRAGSSSGLSHAEIPFSLKVSASQSMRATSDILLLVGFSAFRVFRILFLIATLVKDHVSGPESSSSISQTCFSLDKSELINC